MRMRRSASQQCSGHKDWQIDISSMEKQRYTEPLKTTTFTVPAQEYARRTMTMMAEKWWWMPVLPLTLAVIMGLSDWRWLVVAMAMLFVAFPVTAMFAWFSLLTKSEPIRDLYPHVVTLQPDGTIETTYYPMPQKYKEPAAGESPKEISISPRALRGCSIDSRRIVIDYDDKPSRILIIPLSAFPAKDDAYAFFRVVDSTISASAAS